jgi:hypothetical protein
MFMASSRAEPSRANVADGHPGVAARAASPMVMNDSLTPILGRRRNGRNRPMAGRTAFVSRIVVVARKQRESGAGYVSAVDIVRGRE